MCMTCEGADQDEVRFSLHGTVERQGFAVVGVGDLSGREPPWAYTLGLIAGFGHPELVIVGGEPEAMGEILNHVAAMVCLGEGFEPGSPEVTIHGSSFRIGSVHFDEWTTGRFAQWVDYYGSLGPPHPQPYAVQVIWADRKGRFPGDTDFDRGCPRGDNCQPLFDRPGGMRFAQGPNRAERRRRMKEKGPSAGPRGRRPARRRRARRRRR